MLRDSLLDCCKESVKNDDMTGVDALLVVVPYYNKPSQEGIYQHYKAIAESTELPIVLYNVPGRTGVNIEAIKKAINPDETLFVVDSMTGQDAVNTAKEFNDRLMNMMM